MGISLLVNTDDEAIEAIDQYLEGVLARAPDQVAESLRDDRFRAFGALGWLKGLVKFCNEKA